MALVKDSMQERLATQSSRQGILICVSGPSGVGKGSVIAGLGKLGERLVHSVSVTTRAPRPGEQEGVHYYFRSKEAFEAMLANNEIMEHDIYVGNYYGTPVAPIRRQLAEGIDIIMDVTVPGSLTTMQHFPDVVTIFLLPPSLSALRERLEKRGTEDKKVIDSRLLKAVDEIEMASRFQYNVINDDLDETCRAIKTIIEAERFRASRLNGIEKRILER